MNMHIGNISSDVKVFFIFIFGLFSIGLSLAVSYYLLNINAGNNNEFMSLVLAAVLLFLGVWSIGKAARENVRASSKYVSPEKLPIEVLSKCKGEYILTGSFCLAIAILWLASTSFIFFYGDVSDSLAMNLWYDSIIIFPAVIIVRVAVFFFEIQAEVDIAIRDFHCRNFVAN